jgi:hypothetical protein
VPAVFHNAIVTENALPGDPSWNILKAPPGRIEAFASEISVAPGGTLHLHVSTDPAAAYEVRIFRLGWYEGLGGRLLLCLPSCTGSKQGAKQPAPGAPDPTTGLLRANWPITDTVAIPESWLSGYYVADVVLAPRRGFGVGYQLPFIVRGHAGNHSAILVQAAVNTWQAYNNWGGKSLYAFNSTHSVPAVKVSFDRPFSPTVGNASPFTWGEYDLVRFLEHRGYDVTYTTDVDTDAQPPKLLDHKMLLVAGHDEYWTKAMRDGVEHAIASGVSVAFFGADISGWQARYEDGSRTLVEYRSAEKDPETGPALTTIEWRRLSPPRPECQMMAVQHSDAPEQAGIGSGIPAYTVAPSATASPWLAGTGLAPGSQIHRVIGYEWDSYVPGCVSPKPKSGPTLLFEYAGPPSADAVTYTAPSGAQVFSSGTLLLNWALDNFGHKIVPENPGLQRFVTNMLDAMIGAP